MKVNILDQLDENDEQNMKKEVEKEVKKVEKVKPVKKPKVVKKKKIEKGGGKVVKKSVMTNKKSPNSKPKGKRALPDFNDADTFVIEGMQENTKRKSSYKTKGKLKEKRGKIDKSSINLIPQELVKITSGQKRRIVIQMLIVLAISFFLCGSSYLVFDYFEKKSSRTLTRLDFVLKEVQSRIDLFKDVEDDAKKLQYKVGIAKFLLENHVYSTNLLEKLEDNTVPNVFYKKLSSNLLGGVTVSAFALDFESVARQVLAFQQLDFVKDVDVSSIGYVQLDKSELLDESFPQSVVTFDIVLDLEPNVFIREISKN